MFGEDVVDYTWCGYDALQLNARSDVSCDLWRSWLIWWRYHGCGAEEDGYASQNDTTEMEEWRAVVEWAFEEAV